MLTSLGWSGLSNPADAGRKRRLWLTVLAACAACALAVPGFAQTGACCVGTACSLKTFAACEFVFGDWRGPGTNCASNPCAVPGRCCSLGNCTFVADASCSGVWTTGGSCSPNPCPPATGTCCNNGLCTVVTQAQCGVSGSTWTISGFCPPNPCPSPACDIGIPDRSGGRVSAVMPGFGNALLVGRGTVLELYDKTNPNAPVPFFPPRRLVLSAPAVKIAYTPGWTRAFVLMENGDVTYVTLSSTPTISDPQTIPSSGVDIEANLDRVYIVKGTTQSSSEVSIWERGSSGTPVFLERFTPALNGFIFDRVTRIGSTLWLGLRSDVFAFYGIEGWDVATPSAPIHIATSVQDSLQAPLTSAACSNIRALHAIGNKLLVGFYSCNGNPGSPGTDSFRVADVTNPALAVWHAPVSLPDNLIASATTGNHLRVALQSRGVLTYDTTNSSSLALLGSYLDPFLVVGQIAAGSFTDYWAGGAAGLMTMNTTNPASVSIRTTLPTAPANAYIVRRFGNTTAVIDNDTRQLRIFDFTMLESQQLRASFALGDTAGSLELMKLNAAAPLLACIGMGGNGVKVIDITTPTAPALRSTIPVYATLMATLGSRLYMFAPGEGLRVYTLTTPTSPGLLSTTPFGGISSDYTCMTAWTNGSGDVVGLGTRDFGLWLIDAANANAPFVSAVYNPVPGYSVHSVAKGGQKLFVSATQSVPGSSTPAGRLESLNVNSITNPLSNYVSAPGVGAGPKGPYDSLNFVSNGGNRFLLGVVVAGSVYVVDGTLTVFAADASESKLYSIFDDLFFGLQSGLAVSTDGSRITLAGGPAGLFHVSPPQSWAPGFSSPAFGASQTFCLPLPNTATLSVDALAGPSLPVTYRWFRSGSAIILADGITAWGSTISGAGSDRLGIAQLRPQDAGHYFCEVTSNCGARISQFIELVICLADYNCTGTITVQDIFDFLADYFAGAPKADVNGSGTLTVQDIFDFLSAYFSGCN